MPVESLSDVGMTSNVSFRKDKVSSLLSATRIFWLCGVMVNKQPVENRVSSPWKVLTSICLNEKGFLQGATMKRIRVLWKIKSLISNKGYSVVNLGGA